MRFQPLGHGQLSSGERQVERRLTVLCPRVYVRPSFHQRPREFDIAVLSRGVERRPASVLPRVDAGPMIEQKRDYFSRAASGGCM